MKMHGRPLKTTAVLKRLMLRAWFGIYQRKMKVLFISSGKSGDVGHVVKNQGESLSRFGIEIEYFTINSGFSGYIRAIPC